MWQQHTIYTHASQKSNLFFSTAHDGKLHNPQSCCSTSHNKCLIHIGTVHNCAQSLTTTALHNQSHEHSHWKTV